MTHRDGFPRLSARVARGLPPYPPVGPTHRLPDLYGSLSALLGIRADWLHLFALRSDSERATALVDGCRLIPLLEIDQVQERLAGLVAADAVDDEFAGGFGDGQARDMGGQHDPRVVPERAFGR